MTTSPESNSLRSGSRISDQTFYFRFDGRDYIAQAGDTAASALLANGVRLFGRSIKYRRRRGLLAAGSDEPNALLTIGSEPNLIPNIPATRLLIRPGMELFSQNRWPSLDRDASAFLSLGKNFFSAGFYYKTFIWPSWKSYEGIIRRLAGLGNAPLTSNLPAAAREHRCCDALVAGAGPAGLVAALRLARAGKSVLLCETSSAVGGELAFELAQIDGLESTAWVAELKHQLQDIGVEILMHTTVVSAREGIAIAHSEPSGFPDCDDGLLHIHAEQIYMATGASEYPIAFANNDLPGVMLLSAAEDLLAKFGVKAGRRAVLFGNHDRIYAAAARLRNAGITIAAIADSRDHTSCSLREDLIANGVQCFLGTAVRRGIGKKAVTGADLISLNNPGRKFEVECDLIATSGGWTSWSQSSDNALSPDKVLACGAAAGNYLLNDVILDACTKTSSQLKLETSELPHVETCDPAPCIQPFWSSPASAQDEKLQFVDFQNDVSVADLRQSVSEGFTEIEHAKRYTTLAFGTDQGRTAKAIGTNILAAFANNHQPAGHSKARRPYRSVSINALSCWRRDHFLRPVRRTPMTGRHITRDAVMQPTGLFLRPQYFPENGSSAQEAGLAEATRTRATGGITDISTLGMVEISGPDAATFIDRLCLSRGSEMRSARGKYAVILREDGFVLDDGILVRMQEERFLLMTSTGHAGSVLAHLEYWHSMEWAGRGVAVTDVGDSWGGIVVAGRRSADTIKDILGPRWADEISALSHMGFLEADWNGNSVRLLRASFSGEHAYEVYARPHVSPLIWDALIDHGYKPYGLEALDIMRIEKGYLTGAEINGQTVPGDLGFGKLLDRNPNCIGAGMLDRSAFKDDSRHILFGVRSKSPLDPIFAGAQITRKADSKPIGHVTSAARSPMLETYIGLALVDSDFARSGCDLMARDPVRGVETPIELAPVCQFDAERSRLK